LLSLLKVGLKRGHCVAMVEAKEQTNRSDFAAQLSELCRESLISVFVFSIVTNLLSLTPIFYMMNVFGKAVATSSLETLGALATVAAFSYIILALMEWTRSKVLVFVATRLDKAIAPTLYDACFSSESGGLSTRLGNTPLTDLNNFRQFVCSNNAMVFFDLPWLPLFLFLMLLFHPVLAVVAVICMVFMFVLAILNQRATTSSLKESNRAASAIRNGLSLELRNAEVATAMGMVSRFKHRWRRSQDAMLALQEKASSSSAAYSAVMKVMGLVMQGIAITIGAVLVMRQELAPASMIGAALLLGKSLAPITQAVGSWRAYVEAYGQYLRLRDGIASYPLATDAMPLPAIKGEIEVTDLVLAPPGSEKPTIRGVSFKLSAGTTTMIVGASAAGKSTLVRAILGLWPAAEGEVRIDGADATHYNRDELGPQIGYLPQAVELFDGTIAENIARFGVISSDDVIRAAVDAGIHEMILALPEGYDTKITGARGLLSPGQRQRVGLARALYKTPALIVLDEPNSNLDEAGDLALHSAISNLRKSGSSLIVVSHKQSILPLADKLIVMSEGKIALQGPTAEVVDRMKEQQRIKSISSVPGDGKNQQSSAG